MFDNHQGFRDLEQANTSTTGESRVDGSMVDREVPIGLRTVPPTVHDWLDGELTSIEAIEGGATPRHVDFWNRIGAEVASRREMRAPLDLEARIMAALADESSRDEREESARSLTVTPVVAIAAAAGLLALGAALGAAVRND